MSTRVISRAPGGALRGRIAADIPGADDHDLFPHLDLIELAAGRRKSRAGIIFSLPGMGRRRGFGHPRRFTTKSKSAFELFQDATTQLLLKKTWGCTSLTPLQFSGHHFVGKAASRNLMPRSCRRGSLRMS